MASDDVDQQITSFLLGEGPFTDVASFAHWMHEHAPVHRSARGTVFVGGYHECQSVLRDTRLGKGRGSPDDIVVGPGRAHRGALPESLFTASLVHLNPPEHTRLRDVVRSVFTRSSVENMRPAIETRSQELVRRITDRGSAEIVDDLASSLSVWVMGQLIGVPAEERNQFRGLVRRQGLLYEPNITDAQLRDGLHAAREMVAVLAGYVRERRRHPRQDLMSHLLDARDANGARLSKQEVIGLTMLLMGAGFDTTTALIANMFGEVLGAPRHLQRLRDQPALVPAAVEEVLRCQSPIQINARIVLEPAEVAGHRVEPGQWVVALIGVANRDPSVYEDAGTFVLDRYAAKSVAAPLSFSVGLHHCLGAPLARLEAAVALETWLADGVVVDPVSLPLQWLPHATHHCLRELRVQVRDDTATSAARPG